MSKVKSSSPTKQVEEESTNKNEVKSGEEPKEEAMSASDRVLKTEKELLFARERTIQLHNGWIIYLKLISILVIGLSVHHILKIVQQHQKLHNDNDNESFIIHGIKFGTDMMDNALFEVISLTLSVMQSLFLLSLHTTSGDSSAIRCFWYNKIYVICSVLVIIQLGMHIYHHQNKNKHDEVDNNDHRRRDPEFPISVAFYLIITIALYFMKYGINEMDKHLDLVYRMKVQSRNLKKIYASNDKQSKRRNKLNKKKDE